MRSGAHYQLEHYGTGLEFATHKYTHQKKEQEMHGASPVDKPSVGKHDQDEDNVPRTRDNLITSLG